MLLKLTFAAVTCTVQNPPTCQRDSRDHSSTESMAPHEPSLWGQVTAPGILLWAMAAGRCPGEGRTGQGEHAWCFFLIISKHPQLKDWDSDQLGTQCRAVSSRVAFIVCFLLAVGGGRDLWGQGSRPSLVAGQGWRDGVVQKAASISSPLRSALNF